MWRCCLNPKVMGVLAVVGLVAWLAAPSLGSAAIPVLFVLVCPLSMGAMAWQMKRNGGSCEVPPTNTDVAEIQEMRAEIASIKAQRASTENSQNKSA